MPRELKPKLRFPSFDHEWKATKLKHVSNYQKGFAFKSEDYRRSGARIIRVSDLSADSIKLDNEKIYIDQENLSKHGRYIINSGEVIITTVGSRPHLKESAVGRAIFVEKGEEHLLNQNLLKLEFDDENVSNFIFRYLNSPRYIDYITSIQRGNANQSNIAVKDLLEYPLSITSKEEQQKISDFLFSVDKKISLLKEKHALLTKYKKGVMQKLFKQELRFTDDNGNDFPYWQEQRFEQVFERVTRKNKEDNQNVLTISAQLGLINQEKYFNKSVSAKDVTGYYLLEKGNFAYNKSYSKGYPMGAIKRLNNYERGVVSTLYICFKSHGEQYDEFWEQYFEAGNLNREINKIAQEGARNHGLLNVSVTEFFHDIKVVAPCAEEQQKIADFLQALDIKLDAVNQQIELTQTFKKGLLQQMFV